MEESGFLGAMTAIQVLAGINLVSMVVCFFFQYRMITRWQIENPIIPPKSTRSIMVGLKPDDFNDDLGVPAVIKPNRVMSG